MSLNRLQRHGLKASPAFRANSDACLICGKHELVEAFGIVVCVACGDGRTVFDHEHRTQRMRGLPH